MNYLKAIVCLLIIRLLLWFFTEEEIVGIMGQFFELDEDKGLLVFSDKDGNVQYAEILNTKELLSE